VSESLNQLFDLSGKVAVVTGASSGLGAHFARVLASAGASVVLAARRLDRLRLLEQEIVDAGGIATSVAADVTERSAVNSIYEHAQAALGTPTVVVNNSGLARPRPVLEIDDEEWDLVVDTNLRGAWMVAREGAKRMVAADVGGSIINLASITGIRVAGGLTSYAASKAGLLAITRNMSLELARNGVRVNAMAPGYILTDMNRAFFESAPGLAMIGRIPQRRIGRPEELDGPLLLLASDASSYMTGSVLTIDGGHMHSTL
jgi:NAD(P)-dependent dehydrogenase (short-subunit alcohol dehydrogenase family)